MAQRWGCQAWARQLRPRIQRSPLSLEGSERRPPGRTRRNWSLLSLGKEEITVAYEATSINGLRPLLHPRRTRKSECRSKSQCHGPCIYRKSQRSMRFLNPPNWKEGGSGFGSVKIRLRVVPLAGTAPGLPVSDHGRIEINSQTLVFVSSRDVLACSAEYMQYRI